MSRLEVLKEICGHFTKSEEWEYIMLIMVELDQKNEHEIKKFFVNILYGAMGDFPNDVWEQMYHQLFPITGMNEDDTRFFAFQQEMRTLNMMQEGGKSMSEIPGFTRWEEITKD